MVKEAKKILVLDDNEDIRELFTTLLRIKGYHVEAVDKITNELKDNRPDLILMDVLLSGNNGVDICRALKNDPDTADIPVVMISALTDIQQDCIKAGANDFIQKPFNISSITDCINNQLAEVVR